MTKIRNITKAKNTTTKNIIISCLVFLSISLSGFVVKSQKLSDSAEIYALVISPGTELYAAFGHNAFWVKDLPNDVNMVFHYGTFDFRTPNFYVKFVRGRLNYMLAIQEYKYFVYEYTTDRRDVWKLKLNLNSQQKQKMFDFLMWQSQEANKYYKYDFFMDNCATRLRYVLEKIFGDSVVFPNNKLQLTYRQAIKPYLRDRPWTRFGINLLLGLPADKKLDYYSAMFLPYFVDTALQKTFIQVGNQQKPIVSDRSEMIVSGFEIGQMPLFNPDLVFWLIAAILIFISIWYTKFFKVNIAIDITLFSILSIVSLLMLFMWFGTDHTPTKWNFNLLWANPLFLWFVFVFIKNKKTKLIAYFSMSYAVLCFLLVISYPFFIQQFDTATIPILILLAFRNYNVFRYYRKK